MRPGKQKQQEVKKGLCRVLGHADEEQSQASIKALLSALSQCFFNR